MDPAIKVAMALCVLLGGFCSAMLFRNDESSSSRAAAEALRIRSRPAPVVPVVPKPPAPCVQPVEPEPEAPPVGPRPTVVVQPQKHLDVPPPLAAKYPTTQPPSAYRGKPLEMMLPIKASGGTHRIVDGDTLEGLAQRYLGSAARAGEIFEANRNVLSSPRMLPIGVELKIPAADMTPVK